MDRYVTNPFRILGIKSTATVREAKRSADRLLQWIELGEAPTAEPTFPSLPPLTLDRETIKGALREIEDPARRIRHELFWPSSDFVHHDQCFQALRDRRFSDFLEISRWEQQQAPAGDGDPSEASVNAGLAKHQLAVFYHLENIEQGRATLKNGSAAEPAIANWPQVFASWKAVLDDDVFWDYLVGRQFQYQDPRAMPEDVQALRQTLSLELLKTNAELGLKALSCGNVSEFVRQGKSISSAPFSNKDKERAGEMLAAGLLPRFNRVRQRIQEKLSETAIANHFPLEAAQAGRDDSELEVARRQLAEYLDQIEPEIKNSVLPIASQICDAVLHYTDSGNEILEGTVRLLRALSLAMNNQAGNPASALRVCLLSQTYAVTTDTKNLLSRDEVTLRFLSCRDAAVELLRANKIRASLEKLEEALKYAQSEEDRQTTLQWAENARRMLAFEGLEQIGSAPSLYTFNGIGTKLYGRRNYDPHTQSYVATYFFTILYVPIFPLAAYRVIDAGPNLYRFLGQVPLRQGSLGLLAIAPILIAIIVAIGGSQSNTPTTPTYSPTRQENSDGASTRAALAAWLKQERARLDAENTALKDLSIQLDLEKVSLDREVSIATTASDRKNVELKMTAFNSRVDDFNSRVQKFHTDAATFNQQVDIYNKQR